MANEPSKDSSLFPDSDGEREDSGLRDILSVASSMKDMGGDADDGDADDSGVILFTSGEDDGGASNEDDDGALFGFSGGLGGGFGDDQADDEVPIGAGSSLADQVVAEQASNTATTSTSATVAAAKSDDGGNRTPLIIVAAVLGLALVGGGLFMMNQNKGEEQVATADATDEAAVGKAEEPTPEPDDAGAAPDPEPEPIPEPEPEVDTEGIDTEGFDTEGCDPADPMCTKEGLLEADSGGGSKGGKWGGGKSVQKADGGGDDGGSVEEEEDPLPMPNGGGGGKVSEEDVDCLLNPDLAKCAGGSGPAPKEKQVLKPKIPEKLTQAELRQAMNSVKGTAKKCGLKHGVPPGTIVQVHVSVESKGTVSEVKATGEYAGTPLGSCVEAAAKKATFPEFKTPQMGFDFPFVM